MGGGPLDEIQFWNARAVNLDGIRNQLDNKALLHTVNLLESVQSPYMLSFLELKDRIQQVKFMKQNKLPPKCL